MENFPNFDSYLDAIVTQNGKFMVTDFHLGSRKKDILEELHDRLPPYDQESEERYYGRPTGP
jgi:hypothetical protein